MEAKNGLQTTSDKLKKQERRRFLLLCLGLFGVFSASLSLLGLTPQGVSEFWKGVLLSDERVVVEQTTDSRGVVRSLIIDKINLDTPIYSPTTQEDSVLEKALQEGPVQYPGSGLLGTKQNILIFGHSSGLPVVHNQAYKVFNRLKELEVGDRIRLNGQNSTFEYQVSSVEKVLALNQRVDIGKREDKLILSTCNVWGAKEERYVVIANFVKSYSR